MYIVCAAFDTNRPFCANSEAALAYPKDCAMNLAIQLCHVIMEYYVATVFGESQGTD
jgi:hypothetical protein